MLTVEIEAFRRDLLSWYAKQKRDLPWRRTRDPYAIWISEIMLQQTRVAAVIPYYERFLERFPNFNVLAEAPESEPLAQWAGLGYYHRARNLQKAAQAIRAAGRFPETYVEIRALPGIGDYTAAAIASISFNLPHAVLDGNVFRVLSRVFDDDTNIASGTARKHFSELADSLLDRKRPGAFNQSMMELGATVCLPNNPQCLLCPVSGFCMARRNGRQDVLPVKIVPQKSVQETRILFWIEDEGNLLAWQRPMISRFMPGFWELPEREQLPQACAGAQIGSFRHGITFHNYRFEIVQAAVPAQLGPCEWVSLDALESMPVSTVLRKAKHVVTKYHNKRALARTAGNSS
jgi:A/G-specific adenine glycosylase